MIFVGSKTKQWPCKSSYIYDNIANWPTEKCPFPLIKF